MLNGKVLGNELRNNGVVNVIASCEANYCLWGARYGEGLFELDDVNRNYLRL